MCVSTGNLPEKTCRFSRATGWKFRSLCSNHPALKARLTGLAEGRACLVPLLPAKTEIWDETSSYLHYDLNSRRRRLQFYSSGAISSQFFQANARPEKIVRPTVMQI